jgi:hypothetical protein
MWITAESTEQAINEAYDAMEQSAQFFLLSIADISESFKRLDEPTLAMINARNPELIDDIKDIIKWG